MMGGGGACVAVVVVGVVGVAVVSAFLLSGYFCCQLRCWRVNAKLAAKSFQRDVAASKMKWPSESATESLLQHGQPVKTVVLASLP